MVAYDPYTAEQLATTTGLHNAAPQTVAGSSDELDLSRIMSYEDGWDNWDGPVWPVGTAQVSWEVDLAHPAEPTTKTASTPKDSKPSSDPTKR